MDASKMDGYEEWLSYWDERASETIGFSEPLRGAEIEKYRREHPLPTREEALEIVRRSQEGY